MAQAHDKRLSFVAAKAKLDEFLVRSGMRRTPERERVLEQILRLNGHFTPEDVVTSFGRGREAVSLATVYRNLPVLCRAGLLRRTCLSTGEMKYELDWNRQHHDHLICAECDAVIEFEYEAIEVLQRAVAEQHGYVLTSHYLELVGLCPDCRAEGKGSTKPGRAAEGRRVVAIVRS